MRKTTSEDLFLRRVDMEFNKLERKNSDAGSESVLALYTATKSPALRAAPFEKGGIKAPSFITGGAGRISSLALTVVWGS